MDLLAPGTELAGYRIDRILGRGGMATVYKAQQVLLDRPVALKILHPSYTDDPLVDARFRREGRVVASLEHPNILPVYEAGETSGRLYIAMRLVDGPTLMQLIDGGLPEVRTTLAVVRQIADALDHAHHAGLIHRDVKPHNILMDGHGRAYLADFGLAALRGTDDDLTRTEEIHGTVAYMAPEVIRGGAVTSAADIYGLGCVLFEALTGARPFPKESAAAALFAHVNEPPPKVTDLRPELGSAIDSIVARALAKDPGSRHRSASELAADVIYVLGETVSGTFAAARPVSERPRRRSRPRLVDPAVARPPSSPPPPPPPSSAGDLAEEPDPDEPEPIESVDPAVRTEPVFRLAPTFRYVHDPLVRDDDGIPLLGNEEVIDKLRERILYSSGGAFLITGFRGVGKTTVIARAMDVLREAVGDATVLPIRVNVARPRTVGELLFEIIRRVFETLDDERVLGLMSEDVQRELLLAYARTSLSFNESRSQATERVRGLSASLPTLLDALTPKVDMSIKTTSSLASQVSFLAYTAADVEHDFLRIVSLIDRGEVAAARRRRWGRRRAPATPAWQGKLVVIVDELDKLTVDDEGLRCVTELLSGLKNLLTARGVHFLFVAGPDLHDVALRESRRGNSVFESVFSWQFYVPCLWDATDRLLDAIIGASDLHDWPRPDSPLRDTLRDYLRFKSRGVPRLLLMELNSLVRWDDRGAYIDLSGPERPRVQFYADLERVVGAFVRAEAASYGSSTLAIDQDRWWLGAYYVTDWVLQSGGATFTAADLVRTDHDRALHPVFTLSTGKVTDFLAHLAVHEIVRVTRGRAPNRLFIGDAPGVQEDSYELSPDIRAQLAQLALVDERERTGLAAGESGEPWADSVLGSRLCDGRYELLERVGRGENGTVYRARDHATAGMYAIKLLDGADDAADGRTRARFERGAELAKAFVHPNIVRTHASFEDQRMLGLVMDLVDGTPLSAVLTRVSMTPEETATIALALASAIDHVAGHGAGRLDLKPANVLLDDGRTPIVVGVDLARPTAADATAITRSGVCLATPAYGAPEQLRGEPVDIRADIYSLGLIMYEMIAGRRARRGTLDAVFAQAGSALDVSDLKVSHELRDVIATAAAPRRERRFDDAEAMIAALRATPELVASSRRDR
jgi:serine/threonine-protein kinase